MHKYEHASFLQGVQRSCFGASRTLATGAAIALAAAASASYPSYRLITIELPTTEDIAALNPQMGINRLGEVVGTAQDEFGEKHPFVWLPADNYSLAAGGNLLDTPSGGFNYQAFDININGNVAGTASPPDAGPCQAVSTTAWIWELENNLAYPLYLMCGPKNQIHAINDSDVVAGNLLPGFVPEALPFRLPLGGSIELLDLGLPSHEVGGASDIANSGFTVGTTSVHVSPDPLPPCGSSQDYRAPTYWQPGSSTAGVLETLWNPPAIAVPRGVSDTATSHIVGYGEDPGDPTEPCRIRALFWKSHAHAPVALPYLIENGQPLVDEQMKAEAVAVVCPSKTVQVVGRSESANAAVLWRSNGLTWIATDLNNVKMCGNGKWKQLESAYDINDKGWIVGTGELINGDAAAFVLVPTKQCLGDIAGPTADFPDGQVDGHDLTYLQERWGTSNCLADLNGDGTVDGSDTALLLNNWGPCDCYPE